MSIRRARVTDYAAVKAMLADAGLPTEDFARDHLAFVAEDRGEIVAAIGFQNLGESGLLRSLVVADDLRFKGLGRRLVAALEAHAGKHGVREIWLLTEGVDAYFQSLGYALRDRAAAPAAIRATVQFASLCPEDATLMSKRLG